MTTEQKRELSPADLDAIKRVIKGLEKAWNNADHEDFSLWFQEDADFVNVYGMYAKGRREISEGHSDIFNTVYQGSRLSVTPLNVRAINPDVALVHLRSRLTVPKGPMTGEHEALPSMAVVRDSGAWRIASFHNTFVQDPPRN